ncbi:YkgJ family cysteine cluster protein [Bacteroidota bacterium]
MSEKQSKIINDIENAFYRDGYLLAKNIISSEFDSRSIYTISKNTYKIIDDLLSLFSDRCKEEKKKIACKEGCAWCCHQTVMVLPFEVFYIINYLYTKISFDDIKIIKDRTIEKNKKTSKMLAMDYIHHKEKCPFLENETCLVYEYRPMACRIYLSSAVDTCIHEFRNPKKVNIFPSLYDLPLKAGKMMNEGIAKALAEKGIAIEELKFESALKQVFEKEITVDEWLKGKKVFFKKPLTKKEIKYMEKF